MNYLKQKFGLTKPEARSYNQEGFVFFMFEERNNKKLACYQRRTEKGLYESIKLPVDDLKAGYLKDYIEAGFSHV